MCNCLSRRGHSPPPTQTHEHICLEEIRQIVAFIWIGVPVQVVAAADGMLIASDNLWGVQMSAITHSKQHTHTHTHRYKKTKQHNTQGKLWHPAHSLISHFVTWI